MSNLIGELREEFGGETFTFHLNFRDISNLQSEHGENLAGLLDGSVSEKTIPDFGPSLDVLSAALKRGSGLDDDAAEEVANFVMQSDAEIVGRVLAASFSEQLKVNAKAKPKGKPAGGKAKEIPQG